MFNISNRPRPGDWRRLFGRPDELFQSPGDGSIIEPPGPQERAVTVGKRHDHPEPPPDPSSPPKRTIDTLLGIRRSKLRRGLTSQLM